MSPSRSNSRIHSPRLLLLIAIFSLCLILVIALAWEYWRLQKSNAEEAVSILQEYSSQVADEFGQRFPKAVIYYGYSAITKRCFWTGSADELAAELSEEAAGLASSIVVHDGKQLSVWGHEVASDLLASVKQLMQDEAATTAWIPPSGIATTDGKMFYVIGTSDEAGRTFCGFVLNEAGLRRFAQRAFDEGPLSPSSVGASPLGNDSFFVEVQNSVGEPVFLVNPEFDSGLTVSSPVTDDLGGILEGFSVRVSVDPRVETRLVLGGFAESRLPWLIAALASAVLLLAGAIWLVRREQAVMEMREEFVAQVSHELRTPLTQIRMFAETLLLNRVRNDDERRRSLEIIDREAQRLSHMVDNVLRASSVSDAVKLCCRVQQLFPLVREVCTLVQSTNKSVTIELSADESAEAKINADAFREILLNLLDNAIKFGPSDQTIKVALADVEGGARLSVEDQGPGIPDEEKDRIWDKFYRLARERKSAIGGTGIGLAVVYRLTRAMGGRCWFDSRGQGARANIELTGGIDHETDSAYLGR
jgi:signal transduction histidine kinase